MVKMEERAAKESGGRQTAISEFWMVRARVYMTGMLRMILDWGDDKCMEQLDWGDSRYIGLEDFE